MAEILVKAQDSSHPNEDVDRQCYKRGMMVVAQSDGHQWGGLECLPKFAVIKLPLINQEQLSKYLSPQFEEGDDETVYQIRTWTVRWDDLPSELKDKLDNDGELTIKATSEYEGEFDSDWAQFKGYVRNLITETDESGDL